MLVKAWMRQLVKQLEGSAQAMLCRRCGGYSVDARVWESSGAGAEDAKSRAHVGICNKPELYFRL
jgi:hypothetical protein